MLDWFERGALTIHPMTAKVAVVWRNLNRA
jgi:hypothetical protein